jgi:hypothetical protein
MMMKLGCCLLFLILAVGAAGGNGQQTPDPNPAFVTHPGMAPVVINERDLWALQLTAWEEGYELHQQSSCERNGYSHDFCYDRIFRIEVEEGGDTETIRLHITYKLIPDIPDTSMAQSARDRAKTIHAGWSRITPKWLKWEVRINKGAVERLK